MVGALLKVWLLPPSPRRIAKTLVVFDPRLPDAEEQRSFPARERISRQDCSRKPLLRTSLTDEDSRQLRRDLEPTTPQGCDRFWLMEAFRCPIRQMAFIHSFNVRTGFVVHRV